MFRINVEQSFIKGQRNGATYYDLLLFIVYNLFKIFINYLSNKSYFRKILKIFT